jgi:AcrR family transcriptional regulator
MEHNKIDRRVQRTQQLLRDSLLSLILEKGYDELTVQQITENANLGRATFYLHYKDKRELLLECMDVMVDQFIDQFDKFTPEQWAYADGEPIRLVFEFAREQATLYKVIMSGQGGVEVSRRLHQIIATNTCQVIETQITEKGLKPQLPVDFMSNYYAGSLLALVFWWIEMNMPYTAEQMTVMFRRISLEGRTTAIGLNCGLIE